MKSKFENQPILMKSYVRKYIFPHASKKKKFLSLKIYKYVYINILLMLIGKSFSYFLNIPCIYVI